jgi:hypothetical protein
MGQLHSITEGGREFVATPGMGGINQTDKCWFTVVENVIDKKDSLLHWWFEEHANCLQRNYF